MSGRRVGEVAAGLRFGYAYHVLPFVGYGVLALQFVMVALKPRHYQWDFRTFYFGTMVAREGNGNPYSSADLQAQLAGIGINEYAHPFLYPPYTFALFAPFTLVSFFTAYYLWLCIKGVLLVLCIATMNKLVTGWWRAIAPLMLVAMFNGATLADLRAGNVALLECWAMLAGLVALHRNHMRRFTIMIILAAVWKLVLVPFSCLSLLSGSRRRFLAATIPPAVVLVLLALSRAARPDLWRNFGSASAWSETLFLHPTSRGPRGGLQGALPRLLADISYLLDIPSLTMLFTYAVIAAAVFSVTIVTIYRYRNSDVVLLGLYAILAYGCIVPRLQQYSQVLLVVPTIYVLSNVLRPTTSFSLGAFACIPWFYIGRIFGKDDLEPARSLLFLPFEYSTLIVAGMCWLALTYVLLARRPFRLSRMEDAWEGNPVVTTLADRRR